MNKESQPMEVNENTLESQSTVEHIDLPKDLSKSFFVSKKVSNENECDHEEWLLREASKLMHREAELKKRELAVRK